MCDSELVKCFFTIRPESYGWLNVQLPLQGNAKLGDFGLARQLSHSNDYARTVVGTPYYMVRFNSLISLLPPSLPALSALIIIQTLISCLLIFQSPEQVKETRYNDKSDIWS